MGSEAAESAAPDGAASVLLVSVGQVQAKQADGEQL